VKAVIDSEDALASQKEVAQVAKDTLADATVVERASLAALTERRADQKASTDKLAHAQETKFALEAAFGAHFKPIEDGAPGSHFKQLEPFLKQIEIEASLLTALPSSCAKTKESRGGFDVLVIEELQKAIASKIAALGDEVVAETHASAQLGAAAQAAEIEHQNKKAAQMQCAAALEAAMQEQSDRESVYGKARRAVDEFQPQVDAVTAQACHAKSALEVFEAGPLSRFMAYKTNVAVVPQVAFAAVPEAVPEVAHEVAPEKAPSADPVKIPEADAAPVAEGGA